MCVERKDRSGRGWRGRRGRRKEGIKEEIFELIRKSQGGDKEATAKIVEDNQGLVWSVVKKFAGRGLEFDDLYQIGVIGLIKCIEKFDTSFEVKFSTYAVPMIMGEIRRFLRDDGIIKISRPIKELAIKIKYAKDEYIKDKGGMPTINELAEMLDVSNEDIILALDVTRDVESLYQSANKSDGSTVYLLDRVPAKNNDEEKIIDNLALAQVMNKLPQKEKDIITLRYFEDKTQCEVAKIIGVSQVQVSRIEKKVLMTMRMSFDKAQINY